MTILYICSDDRRAGKTALTLALGRRLARDGLAIGYWKPLRPAGSGDEDAAFARQVLRLAEDVAALAPVALTPAGEAADQVADGDVAGELRRQVRDSFAVVAQGKDVLLVEGGEDLAVGAAQGLGPAALLDLMAGQSGDPAAVKALYLARYRGGDLAGRAIAAQRAVGGAFAGALINAVPAAHDWYVAERARPVLAAQGIAVFGALPQDFALATATVRELAAYLAAGVLVGGDQPAMDEPFESIMFGSMSAEDAQRYFSRKQHKLVVARGDRPDVHLAALGTSTRCLLLTGGYPSYPFVLDKAEDLGVPVLSVPADVHATIERLDELLDWARARSMAKIRRFEGLLAGHVDWPALHQALGLG